MLYLEQLVDVVIAEEGQTLMGLEFLIETLGLPMKKIDNILRVVLPVTVGECKVVEMPFDEFGKLFR